MYLTKASHQISFVLEHQHGGCDVTCKRSIYMERSGHTGSGKNITLLRLFSTYTWQNRIRKLAAKPFMQLQYLKALAFELAFAMSD